MRTGARNVILSLKTGLRESEEAALTWDEISISERELTVWKATSEDGTPKTGSSCRIVDFNEDVMELLAAWWSECGKPRSVQTDVQAEPVRGLWSFKMAWLLWARVDSNHRPTDYESAALTS